ncbi:A/G-specific adenine glycosylase [Batrachochytrium salamandrivorans]|nr:A/G-specific adenine glycosylase [Batrachochytrium salamandrivorans]
MKRKQAPAASPAKKLQDVEDLCYPDFAEDLLTWYHAHSRDLPWRGGNPYQVWVSEIMCQQTKVDTVVPYFARWMLAFPTIQDLARADLDEVNKVWAGLGYYRRAKNLHLGAQYVVENFPPGVLPQSKRELLKINGIGVYTAGAIASICFKQRVPAVDGNVLRVCSRTTALELGSKDKQLVKSAELFAQAVLDGGSQYAPGEVNQALMELGALVCTPKRIQCLKCPVSKHCAAYQLLPSPAEIQSRFPKPKLQTSSSSPEPPSKPEFKVTVCVAYCKTRGVLAIKRNGETGILAGQWELVCVEGEDHSAYVLQQRLDQVGVCDACCKTATIQTYDEGNGFPTLSLTNMD